MEKIKVNFRNKVYETLPLLTVSEFLDSHPLPVKHPVAAIVNGHFTRLTKKLRIDSSIEVIELSSSQGRRIYESSMIFMFLAVMKELHPKLQVFIQHSIHRGVYAEVSGGQLSEDQIQIIENRMHEISAQDLPIEKKSDDWDLYMAKMEDQDRSDMINLYRYYRPSEFKFYELNEYQESFYMPLVPTTGTLKYFKLHKYRDGIVLVLPDFHDEGNAIPEFEDRPKLFKTYQEYNEWSRILKVRTVGQLNRYIMNDHIQELVKVAEAFHEKRVANIADQITKRAHVPRLVMIAGPTSSGKTTFSKRLGVQLRVCGFNPVTISMDNYFVNREFTPKDENGDYDFEALEAIDVKLFMNHMTQLLKGEKVELPKFDFKSGTQSGSGKYMQLASNDILVIEGIHGINPKLTTSIPEEDKFRIYIAPLTQLNLHRHDRILASDTRLIRRIVRDSKFRGYSASDTLSRWNSVRRGEKKNIFPLQENADAIFNSALFYELSVLKGPAERELLRVPKDDPMFSEAQRLLWFLSYFLPLQTEATPSTSILKEFVGGSSFKY